MRLIRRHTAMLTVLVLAACGGTSGGGSGDTGDPGGGDGGGSPASAPLQVILLSSNPLDGWVLLPGGAASTSSTEFLVGEDVSGQYYESYLVFPVGFVPADAIIQSARLDVYQHQVLGAPYASLGSVVIDEVDVGAGIQSGVRSYPVLGSAVGVISTTPDVGPRMLDVKALLEGLLAEPMATRRTHLDLRLRFEQPSNADAVLDLARFNDGFDSQRVGWPARIVVTYTLPSP
jgi:hypothetical protein